MKKLRCGGCGNASVELYTNEDNEVTAECASCKSETNLIIAKPKISFDWGDKGGGVLCVF